MSWSEVPKTQASNDPAPGRHIGKDRDIKAEREENFVVKLLVFHSGNPG